MNPPLRAPRSRLSPAATLLAALALLWTAAPPPAAAEDVPVPEDTLVSVTGTAYGNARSEFRLYYGEHAVEVTMESIPDYTMSRDKVWGRKTTVFGRLDRDFPAREDIHALLVYVHDNGTVLRSERPLLKNTMQDVEQLRRMPEIGTIGIAGVVRNRDGDNVLTVGTPGGEVKFDISQLPEGMRRLEGVRPGGGVLVHAELQDDTPLLQLYKGPALRATLVKPLPEGALPKRY